MTPIPPDVREAMASDPYYKRCARKDGECDGRITWEHCFIYGGRQIQEVWAIIPLCVYHHLGAGLVKELNWWIALNRADADDLRTRYPKKDWQQLYSYLESKYDPN